MGGEGGSDGQEREPVKRDDGEDRQSGEEAREVQRKRQDFPKQTMAERRREVHVFVAGVGTATGQASSVLLANPRNNNKNRSRDGESVWRCVIKRRHSR